MLRNSLALLCCSVVLCLLPVTNAQDVGDPYCYGNDCPCDNNDATAGCVNSTGNGALFTGSGSASISADDLTLCGSQLPKGSLCLILIGGDQADLPFKDGKLCLACKASAAPPSTAIPPTTARFASRVWCVDSWIRVAC